LLGVANSREKPAVYDKLNLEVTNFSATTQFPFSLTASFPRGGDLSLKGKCGPINAGKMGATPLETSVTMKRFDLGASGLVSPSSGIQGLVDFDGAISSNGQQAKTSGTVKAEKLKLVAKGAPSKAAVTVKYAVDYDLNAYSGTLTQGDVSIGKAVERLTGSYQTQGQTTTLNMKLNGSDMPWTSWRPLCQPWGSCCRRGLNCRVARCQRTCRSPGRPTARRLLVRFASLMRS
jgi:hypothetical protein